MSSSNLRFFKRGLPFFTIVGAGVGTMYFFQRVRYDFRFQEKKNLEMEDFKKQMEAKGHVVNRDITPEKVYFEMTSADNDTWENIRGPRPDEDNSEYYRAMEKQKREAQERRERQKAAREQKRREMEELGLVADANPPRPFG